MAGDEAELLKEKVITLLARERELASLRRWEARISNWLIIAHGLPQMVSVAGTVERACRALARKLMTTLEFQKVLLFTIEPERERLLALPLGEETPGEERPLPPAVHRLLEEQPAGLCNGPEPGARGDLGLQLGLQRFLWFRVSDLLGVRPSILLVAGYQPEKARFYAPLDPLELSHFQNIGQNLELLLHNEFLLDEVRQEKQRLQELNQTLEVRVSDRTAELKQVIADLESFSYSVSHDLRAPLRAMDAFIQILGEDHGEHLPPEARGLIDRMRSSARRMNDIIDDLLKLARLGRSVMRVVTVDLGALARQIVDELQEQEAAGRDLSVHIGQLPVCRGDPALLRQLLTNLIANAFKFTQRCASARVEVGHGATERGPAYFVRDNGAGFDMRHVERLFGVFQRLHTQSDFPGTGIGLSIVKRIVQRHGGTVWAESSPGQGATFHFALPQPELPTQRD